MTHDEANDILTKAMPKGVSTESFLRDVSAAIKKNDQITHSLNEEKLLQPWIASSGLTAEKLINVLVALKVL